MAEQELKKISQEELDEILVQHKLWIAKQKLKKISQEELNEILAQHKLWVESSHEQGQRADLSYCDLRKLDFPDKVNIEGANIEGANIEDAILFRANIEGANLAGANLAGANLAGANLIETNLTAKAILVGANLFGVNLFGANLAEANLTGANLTGANLFKANFEETNLEGTNLEGTILQYKKSENLEYEIFQNRLKVSQLENELEQAKSENNQSQEQQEKIVKLEKQLELMNQYEQELQQLKNIGNANKALTHALTNTDTQINKNQNNAELCQNWALTLICIDILFVILMPISLNNYIDKFGGWNILFLTFPAVLILFIALSLLRHQKQLIAEIRHYSMLKHKIELYGGILKAAQYIALTQNSKEDNFIKGIFNEIKTELLKSPNFDLNSQPHIFPEEGGNIVEILKSTMELVKISTETSKAAAESVKQAISSSK